METSLLTLILWLYQFSARQIMLRKSHVLPEIYNILLNWKRLSLLCVVVLWSVIVSLLTDAPFWSATYWHKFKPSSIKCYVSICTYMCVFMYKVREVISFMQEAFTLLGISQWVAFKKTELFNSATFKSS